MAQQACVVHEQSVMAVREEAWGSPSTQFERSSGNIHVWRASLDPPEPCVQHLSSILSDAEHARAAQFCFERDRKRFITGRGLLRLILGRYLHISPAALHIQAEATGQPVLAASQAGGIEFNVSHSHGVVLYALTNGRRIGIDIERIRAGPHVDALVDRVLSPRERAVFRALPQEQRPAAFFCAWTRKEAYLKACGQGLSRPLDRIDVSLSPFEPERPLSVHGDPQKPSGWSLHGLTPAPGYAAALAHEGDDVPRLRYAQWPDWL